MPRTRLDKKAPQTFDYLKDKLFEIGWRENNPTNKLNSIVEQLKVLGIKKKDFVNEASVDNKDVTISSASPLYISSTNIDTKLNTDEENKNKRSRGLLRKITRLFEKNTGIKATDDDKLRIAAFTVKL